MLKGYSSYSDSHVSGILGIPRVSRHSFGFSEFLGFSRPFSEFLRVSRHASGFLEFLWFSQNFSVVFGIFRVF